MGRPSWTAPPQSPLRGPSGRPRSPLASRLFESLTADDLPSLPMYSHILLTTMTTFTVLVVFKYIHKKKYQVSCFFTKKKKKKKKNQISFFFKKKKKKKKKKK